MFFSTILGIAPQVLFLELTASPYGVVLKFGKGDTVFFSRNKHEKSMKNIAEY